MQSHDPFDPIHVAIAGSADDPRDEETVEGVVIHRVPHLHPDDVTVLPNGLRVTSLARTLIDMAEEVDRDQLRSMFEQARQMGLLDMDAVSASRARVEWRPSLAMLDDVIAEFSER